ncbi:MAG: hypothetical protein FWG90_14295 [Oscillospiraceae bacterium]|nr:hypothetical protein [Oscillospiraceae bacterium]
MSDNKYKTNDRVVFGEYLIAKRFERKVTASELAEAFQYRRSIFVILKRAGSLRDLTSC